MNEPAVPKILVLDVETFPNIGYIWGKYEQNVIRYTQQSCLATFVAKWLGGNFAHQLTHSLVSKYPALCLENLSIEGLAKTKLAKSMLDAAFGETVRQWKYKSLWNNTHAVQADRFFPSTKLCSECGYKNNNLTLSDREWTCPACGTHHSRDGNASLNLKAEGIRILDALGYMESLNDCGQDVSLAKASSLG